MPLLPAVTAIESTRVRCRGPSDPSSPESGGGSGLSPLVLSLARTSANVFWGSATGPRNAWVPWPS